MGILQDEQAAVAAQTYDDHKGAIATEGGPRQP
jgi:hypothetical protein